MITKRNIIRFLAWLGIFFLCGGIRKIEMLAFSLAAAQETAKYEDFTDQDLIRFHIRAESNATIDQEAKMEVRKSILGYLEEYLTDTTEKTEVRHFVLSHRAELEKRITATMKTYQKDPAIAIYFTKEFFPMRKYGQTVVPAGLYEALRIDLGQARGKNWWCVLYPGLCLIDTEHVLEDPDDKERLEQMLAEKESHVQYKSYFLQWLKKRE